MERLEHIPFYSSLQQIPALGLKKYCQDTSFHVAGATPNLPKLANIKKK